MGSQGTRGFWEYQPGSSLQQGRLIGAAVAGGVVGYGAEMVHQWAGVWVLAGSQSIPWWIFLVYAVGLYGAGGVVFLSERRLGFPLAWSVRGLGLEAVIVVAFFGLAAALYPWELVLFGMAAAFLAVRMVWFRRRGDPWIMVFVMALDYGVESILAAIGLFTYQQASYLNLPIWLIPFWGTLGLSLRRLFQITRKAA
jgi:hypothetical protein